MTIIQTECVLVASVLTEETVRTLGPCLCTFFASWEYFDSPEASKLACAINKVLSRGLVPSRPMIKAMVEVEYRPWMDHPTFGERNALPLSCAEEEARMLLPHYRSKRLVAMVGDTYTKMIANQNHVCALALALKEKLEGIT